MPLQDKQVKFLEENCKNMSKHEIEDTVGILFKTNRTKWIKKKREPESIGSLLRKWK